VNAPTLKTGAIFEMITMTETIILMKGKMRNTDDKQHICCLNKQERDGAGMINVLEQGNKVVILGPQPDGSILAAIDLDTFHTDTDAGAFNHPDMFKDTYCVKSGSNGLHVYYFVDKLFGRTIFGELNKQGKDVIRKIFNVGVPWKEIDCRCLPNDKGTGAPLVMVGPETTLNNGKHYTSINKNPVKHITTDELFKRVESFFLPEPKVMQTFALDQLSISDLISDMKTCPSEGNSTNPEKPNFVVKDDNWYCFKHECGGHTLSLAAITLLGVSCNDAACRNYEMKDLMEALKTAFPDKCTKYTPPQSTDVDATQEERQHRNTTNTPYSAGFLRGHALDLAYFLEHELFHLYPLMDGSHSSKKINILYNSNDCTNFVFSHKKHIYHEISNFDIEDMIHTYFTTRQPYILFHSAPHEKTVKSILSNIRVFTSHYKLDELLEDYIPFQNGMLNKQTHEFISWNKPKDKNERKKWNYPQSYHWSYTLTCDYPTLSQPIPTPVFDKFLGEITQNDANKKHVIMAMLYQIITCTTKHQLLFFLIGTGGNGKTVIQEIAAGLMEQTSWFMPLNNQGEQNFNFYPLKTKHLTCIAETKGGYIKGMEMWKQISGGSKIMVAQKFKPVVNIEPKTNILVCSNNSPTITDTDSESMNRRLVCIPFTYIVPKHKINPNLSIHLKAEYTGIIQKILAMTEEDSIKIIRTWQKNNVGTDVAGQFSINNESEFALFIDHTYQIDTQSNNARGPTTLQLYNNYIEYLKIKHANAKKPDIENFEYIIQKWRKNNRINVSTKQKRLGGESVRYHGYLHDKTTTDESEMNLNIPLPPNYETENAGDSNN
jgi:P4 family phage/plasmid primase-like protien